MFSLSAVGIVSLVVIGSALGQAIPPQKPNIGTIDVSNNYEFGALAKSFRVQYPGICDVDMGQKVLIKISNIGSAKAVPVHTFQVPIDDVTNGKVYYFGLKDAQPGKFSVEVCLNENNCSDMSKSLTELLHDSQIRSLTCHKVTKKSVEVPASEVEKAKGNNDPTYRWEIENKNAGPITITPEAVKGFMTKEQLDDQHSYLIWKSQRKNDSCTGSNMNPCYVNNELYLNYFYSLTHVNELYIAPTDRNAAKDKVVTVADEYCGRKYLLSSNVHLVDPQTKEVKYRFKTTLNSEIPTHIRDMYMFPKKDDPAQEKLAKAGVPVERVYYANIAPGTYDVWVANCFTEKDKVDSTICTRTFVKDSFQIGGVNEKEATAERTAL